MPSEFLLLFFLQTSDFLSIQSLGMYLYSVDILLRNIIGQDSICNKKTFIKIYHSELSVKTAKEFFFSNKSRKFQDEMVFLSP